MASDFQKDLYRKKGSSFSMWDICIGLGLSLILTGLGLKAKDKYLPVRLGARNERIRPPEDTEIPKENNTEKHSGALGKLGL